MLKKKSHVNYLYHKMRERCNQFRCIRRSTSFFNKKASPLRKTLGYHRNAIFPFMDYANSFFGKWGGFVWIWPISKLFLFIVVACRSRIKSGSSNFDWRLSHFYLQNFTRIKTLSIRKCPGKRYPKSGTRLVSTNDNL